MISKICMLPLLAALSVCMSNQSGIQAAGHSQPCDSVRPIVFDTITYRCHNNLYRERCYQVPLRYTASLVKHLHYIVDEQSFGQKESFYGTGLDNNYLRSVIDGYASPSYDVSINLIAAKGNDEASRTFNEELGRVLFGTPGGSDVAMDTLFSASDAIDAFAPASAAMCRVYFDTRGLTLDSVVRAAVDSIATDWATSLIENGYSREFELEYPYADRWTLDMKATVDTASYPGVAAYNVDVVEYTGGAHGSGGGTCTNLSLLTGKVIHAADFFVRDKLDNVKRLIIESLLGQYRCFSIEQLSEDTGIHPRFEDIHVRDDNFLLLRDSVQFRFNSYEIGCGAAGVVTTRVSYSDLAPYTNQDILPRK